MSLILGVPNEVEYSTNWRCGADFRAESELAHTQNEALEGVRLASSRAGNSVTYTTNGTRMGERASGSDLAIQARGPMEEDIMADVYPVVAGTDGSVRAGAAVTQAAAEAGRRDLPLRLIYGFAPLYGYAGLDPTPPPDILESCQGVLDAEKTRLLKDFPELDISTEVVVSDPSVALVKESSKATIMYVGARGLGAVRRLLLGSVSSKVAAHSKCPVVVVRGTAGDERGPVVVGMSPEGGSQEAVNFAFEEARRRGTGVRVIQSQQHAAANFDTLPETAMRSMIASRMSEVADRGRAAFDKIRQDYPDVEATLDISMLHAVDALLEASNDACITVVGSHGAGAMTAQLLGSVTHGVLTGAPIVAVIPKEV